MDQEAKFSDKLDDVVATEECTAQQDSDEDVQLEACTEQDERRTLIDFT